MGKTLADLQSNISISAENAVSGTLKWVEGYTGFSSNPAEQSGNYLALRIDAGGLEDATIVATYNGREVTLDSDQIIIVRHAEGEDTITFTASKEGYMTGTMTLDLSNLTFAPEPYKLLNEFASVGLTQSPAGDEFEPTSTVYTLTGSVQWSTTYNDNRISYAGNFNKNIEGGTSIEISYGTGSGKVVLFTATSTPIGDIQAYDGWIVVDNAAIAAGSWYITITDSEDNVLLSQRVNASALTLEAAPVDPKTLPQIKLSDVSYHNVNYTISDFMSVQGIIERSDDSSTTNDRKSMPIIKNATFKRVSLNGGQTYGYYLPFTANTESEMEHNGSYYPVQYVDPKGEGGTINILASASGTRACLLEIADVWATNSSNIQYVEGKVNIRISANSTKTRIIVFENCIFENRPAIDPTGNVYLEYSDITYGGVNYQASDFVVGGTISKSANNVELIISNATFKWNPLQGETANAYYLPIINTGDGWYNYASTGRFSASTAIGQVPVTSVKTRGTTGDLIKFVEGTGSNPCMIKINNTTASMRSGCLNINDGQVYLTLSNCTFEPPLSPAENFVNNGSAITLNNTDVLYKDAASAGTDTFQAGQYITSSTTNSSGSSYSGTSSAPYRVDVYVNPVATDTWTAGFVITNGTNGNPPVIETGTTGTLANWSVKMASDNKTITLTYHDTTPATAKIYYNQSGGGTKHVLINISQAT